MASILDVAKEAGVSTATVSRVLNGSYSVTEEKRQRVMEAVERVGYTVPERNRPIPHNPSQAGEKKILLAVCSDFLPGILYSFQSTAAAMGYRAVSIHYDSPDEYQNLVETIESLSPLLAGILLINCADVSSRFQQVVGAYPLVQIGEPIMTQGYNRVVYNDEVQIGEDAAGFFLSQGKRKVGILTVEPVPDAPLFEKKRLNGYYLAMMDHGIQPDPSLVRIVDMSMEGGYEGCQKLLADHPDLEAVVGVTDVVALGASYALRLNGKTFDQVGVLAMDDNDGWDFNHCSFPYINPHHDEMGSTAVHILHAAINGELERDYRVVIQHTLEWGQRYAGEAGS